MSPDAVRMRRNRHHAKGDHRYCSRGQCPDAFTGEGDVLPVAPRKPQVVATLPTPDGSALSVDPAGLAAAGLAAADAAERAPGGIELAVTAFVEALPYRDGDPRFLLAQIAVRLAQRVDETGAMPAAVRELRVMLMQLTEVPDQVSGPLDVHRLRRAQHRLDALLAGQGA